MSAFLEGLQAGSSLELNRQRVMSLKAERAMQQIKERQMAEEFGLHMRELEQAIKIKKDTEDRDAAARAAVPLTYQKVLLETGDKQKAMEATYIAASQHSPKIAGEVASAMSSLERAETGRLQEKRLVDATKFSPRLVNVKDSETGQMVEALEVRPGVYQNADPKNQFTLETNPDGTTRITYGVGKAASGLTPSNTTKVQEKQAQSLATLDVATRLEPLISDETVGAKAFAKLWIKDRILAQWKPELASEERGTAEELVAELRSSAVNELGTPPISDRERKEILKSVPGINEPVDSPARAKILLKKIKKMSAIRAMVASKRLGTDVPKLAADTLDDETVLDLLDKGMITPEQAERAWKLRREKAPTEGQ